MVSTPLAIPKSRITREWTTEDCNKIAIEEFDLVWPELLQPYAIEGNVLHIGSRADILDRQSKWRLFLPNSRVVGVDVKPGSNVDVVADILSPIEHLRKKTGVKFFDAILCPHVLEHVAAPWQAAKTIENLLASEGVLIVTVPWVQGFHEFPNDYWRMSFAGVRSLFPKLAFDCEFYTGAREDRGYRLLWNGTPEHSTRTCRIERNLFQIIVEKTISQPAFDDQQGEKIALSRLFMPACSVNLIGRKIR